MSILELAGVEVEKVEEKPRSKKAPTPRWGTPEEKYRRLCMLALLCRYSYYHRATSLIDDYAYDRLEKLILRIEDKYRDLMHPRSPTFRVGSTRAEDYPRSVRDIWYIHEDDKKLFEPIGKAIEWFTRDAELEFFPGSTESVEESVAQG
jgi:hypothetical protein